MGIKPPKYIKPSHGTNIQPHDIKLPNKYSPIEEPFETIPEWAYITAICFLFAITITLAFTLYYLLLERLPSA